MIFLDYDEQFMTCDGFIRERLYITSGYSLIQCLKALMSYEDKVNFCRLM